MVYCQITILHYILLSIYEFGPKKTQKWSTRYLQNVKQKWKNHEWDMEYHNCECFENHHKLKFDMITRQLVKFQITPRQKGKANKQICTKWYEKISGRDGVRNQGRCRGRDNYGKNRGREGGDNRGRGIFVTSSRAYIPPHRRKQRT